MADSILYVNQSERIPIAFDIEAPEGYTDTLTAPVLVTIYTNRRALAVADDGTILQNLPVDRQDTDPQPTSTAVYEFEPGLFGLPTGIYLLVAHMEVDAPDNLPKRRLESPTARVRVLPDAG